MSDASAEKDMIKISEHTNADATDKAGYSLIGAPEIEADVTDKAGCSLIGAPEIEADVTDKVGYSLAGAPETGDAWYQNHSVASG
ncbi:unnamed protein product [Dovyalis caffra]|uniref:Uncharacterized protein n=1 Tax=Dovyalis caffra TaxID=77055 RepID=A0AAV1SX45_9ROSI|nr:unnamed protein product [Dovyalis caffra]